MIGQKPYRISGTGCALVDYLYKPVDFSGDHFNRYLSREQGDGGLSPGRLVFTEEFEKFSGLAYSQLRSEVTGLMDPVAVNIGGPSIVSLIHTSQLLHDLPVEVRYFGCKGNDKTGDFIAEKLKLTPLKARVYKTSDKFTPFTDVLSDPEYDQGHGERIFINNIGAAWDFFPSDLDASFFNSQIVVFGGTALVPNIHNSLHELLTKAKSNAAITVVNTVYDFLNEKNQPGAPWPLGRGLETLPLIDLLIVDKEEALRHSGCTNAEEALGWFKKHGLGALIITQGPDDIHFYAQSRLFGEVPPSRLPVSEMAKEEVLEQPDRLGDTTGCGDNFVGGVLASIARQQITDMESQLKITEAIAMGVVSGGFTCFYHGGTYFEKNPGEKAEKIKKYYDGYVMQVGINKK